MTGIQISEMSTKRSAKCRWCFKTISGHIPKLYFITTSYKRKCYVCLECMMKYKTTLERETLRQYLILLITKYKDEYSVEQL